VNQRNHIAQRDRKTVVGLKVGLISKQRGTPKRWDEGTATQKKGVQGKRKNGEKRECARPNKTGSMRSYRRAGGSKKERDEKRSKTKTSAREEVSLPLSILKKEKTTRTEFKMFSNAERPE